MSDKNSKSSKIKILLKKKIKNFQFKQKDLIIVIGGDGFMLETLKKYILLEKRHSEFPSYLMLLPFV